MEEKKQNKGLIALLILIIIALTVALVLIVTNKINLTKNNQPVTKENTNITNETSKCDYNINIEKIKEISSSDYNIINEENTSDYTFKLTLDGKININFENNISNISNAIDIKLLNTPSENNILYILTRDGEIYKYDTANYINDDFKATKIDKYSNIKKMINYKTRKENAGGCDYIILIDNDNNYYELDSFCL